jgi:hypothetical protein
VRQEIGERRVPLDARQAPIIQRGALERLVRQRKTTRLNDFERGPEAGRNADRRAQVLGDVRLIEGEAQFMGSDAQTGPGSGSGRSRPTASL